jgi:ubiquinone/menaquinone biosynthesis C-methylase UbiE
MPSFHEGKAKYYKRYRPALPKKLFDFLKNELQLNAKYKLNRLLDLGCGTGQLTIPLSHYFNEVIGVDPSQDILNEAKLAARKLKNIQWLQSYAENLAESLGIFDLITVANAFHWMKHEIVVPWILRHLHKSKSLVLIGSYHTFPQKDTDWEKTLAKLIDDWFDGEKKSIKSFRCNTPWREILDQYAFSAINSFEISETRIWKIETILGYIYSTPFCSVEKLGDQQAKFEQQVKQQLLRINPQNRFIEQNQISVIIADH